MFDFPSIDRPPNFKYHHNFLRTVTFQFNYPPINLTNEHLEKLKQYLINKYPNIQNTNQGRVEFGSGPSPKLHPLALIGLQFTMKDASVVLITTNSQVGYTIQGAHYINYESFKRDYESEINSIFQIIGVAKLHRVAIRKVNVINFDLVDGTFTFADILGMLFNLKMVENMKAVPGSKFLKQGLNTMVFINDRNYQLNLNYGFVKDAILLNKANGILDIDLFNQNENPISEIFGLLEKMNKEIFNIFSWSLQDSTRNQLNGN
jgi:uncharacterized protein (TIGR04255 family)